ncbi:type II CAAX prenyl endopeptidase Rce1 family protein [Dyadobacter sp. CY356]|uniref:CPBP family glutamic-type intramembrane protease n=1 Tax=Dyadobacter sp. CY356 TaxID=2906442 RepID=UPI0038D4EF81
MLLFISIFLGNIIGISVFFLIDTLNLDISMKSLHQNFHEKGLIYMIIIICLVAPIIEEISFRLCLRYSSWNLSLMIGCWIYTILAQIIKSKVSFWGNFIFMYPIMALPIVYFFLEKCKIMNSAFDNFWSVNSRPIFYLSVVLFAFSHTFNFEVDLLTLIMIPILTLPQAIMGVILSYTRLKFGIIYSICLHIIFNAIAVGTSYFSYN